MEIAITVISKVGEYLVEPTKKQVCYLFCFNSIVEDLKAEEKRLESEQDRIKQAVERAEDDAEIIEKDVQEWIVDANKIRTDVHILEEEIQQNKNCLNGWCPNLGCRYWLGRKAAKKTSIVLKLIEDGGKFQGVSHPAPLPNIEFFAPKDFQLFQSSEPTFNQIIEALKNDQINIIGLYGMGGAGKTTLAKAVGNKANKEMFDEVVIAVISQTPDFRIVQYELADSLGLNFEKESAVGRAKQLYSRFTNTKKKILVILDDVWEAFDLQREIGIPSDIDHKGCKVLLTTRREQVCIDMECQQKIQLNVLNEKEGLTLFKKHADVGDDRPALNDMAIEVAKECGGLPLALVAIGRALKGKNINDWKRMSRKLKEAKLEEIPNIRIPGEKSIYHCLRLSYDNLKGEKTKFCFLLCSLFPEDYEIPLEDLVRYAMGLGWYHSIEEARIEVLSIVDYLRDSCLVLDAGEKEFVKMHDMVRDVALWIASKGKNVFMSKTGMRSTEWLNEEGWEQYTAISSRDNKVPELHVELVCPKLEILVLEGEKYKEKLKVWDECFEEMKALKVVTLSYVDLSLKSLQFLINLKTLQLLDCSLRDISSLAKLNKLEILSFRGSRFNELPIELGKLKKLRMLDLQYCHQLKRIFFNLIQSFSHLEELYIGDSFGEWEIEGTSVEKNNASLSELNSLSNLTALVLRINSRCLPKDFHFACHESLRYDIRINTSSSFYSSRPASNVLRIEDIEATSLIAFKKMYPTLEDLHLRNIRNCQNILPSIDQEGLNELISLRLASCQDLKCLVDTLQQRVSAARLPMRFLEKLETIFVYEAPNMLSLFPAMLIQRIHKLKNVDISSCDKLEEVFQLDELCHTAEENHQLLTNLANLCIIRLPQLRCIWKGPTHHVNLHSLIEVKVSHCRSLTCMFTLSLARSLVLLRSLEVDNCESLEFLVTKEGDNNEGKEILSQPDLFLKLECLKISLCERLEYIFPVSVAQGLRQLQELTIENAHQLKQVFYMDHGREENTIAIEGEDNALIELHELKKLRLNGLPTLIRFCPENYLSIWPALEEFTIAQCSSLSTSFITEVVAKVQDLQEKLRILSFDDSCNQLYDIVVSQMRYGFFKNLEELSIKNCEVKVVFELEGLATDGQQHMLSLPNLRSLTLEFLQELEGLCKGPMHLLSLKNLTTLYISQCDKLKYIFSPVFALNLVQLTWLIIEDCKELEQIIFEDDEILLEDHHQPLFFPNLLKIVVAKCQKLKYLFPITIAQGLQSLAIVIVIESFQLEEVFGHKNVDDLTGYKEIVLPELEQLRLQELPSLTNFCHVGYHFKFLPMWILIVEECPKMITRFSYNAQDDFVYAEPKVLKIGNEDESAEFLSQPTMDLVCFGVGQLQEKLPPYMENDEQRVNQLHSSK